MVITSVAEPSLRIDLRGVRIEEVGFTAKRTTTSCPVEIPPRMPPAWLEEYSGPFSPMPNYLGHPDNYIEANPLVTPAHIVPEWYFLPFYAILRAFTSEVWVVQFASFITGGIVDAKFFGVIAMDFGLLSLPAMQADAAMEVLKAGIPEGMGAEMLASIQDAIATGAELTREQMKELGIRVTEGRVNRIEAEYVAIWFGVLVLIVVEVGLITPPVGMCRKGCVTAGRPDSGAGSSRLFRASCRRPFAVGRGTVLAHSAVILSTERRLPAPGQGLRVRRRLGAV